MGGGEHSVYLLCHILTGSPQNRFLNEGVIGSVLCKGRNTVAVGRVICRGGILELEKLVRRLFQ